LEKVLILAAMVKSIDANNLSIKSRERLWAVTTRKLPVMTVGIVAVEIKPW
jgi:hypothetical protein